LHKFCKERRRSPRGCFECGETTHFIADYPKRKKIDSSNKYDYINRNDSSSSEEDEKVKRKQDDLTSLCLMGKSSRNISNSDFDVSDDLSPESLSLRVVELDNALCNQDKLLYKAFCENKKLNLIWRILLLRLKILSTKLIILLATLFYPLRAMCVALSRVRFPCYQ
jgi:hypothetical protein